MLRVIYNCLTYYSLQYSGGSQGQTFLSIHFDQDDFVDGKESVIRTRGSISETLISGNKKDEGDKEEQFKPWYEQEVLKYTFILFFFTPVLDACNFIK